jgi:AraC family transcriptional regulator
VESVKSPKSAKIVKRASVAYDNNNAQMGPACKTSETTLRDYKMRLLRVLVHIQQHLDDALTRDQLAGIACFSPFHFHRIFKGMIGESLHAHIRRLRLERAASRLKLTTHPVIQIALDAGYDTHEAFTRAFKAAFGMAPIHFRARKTPPAGLPAPSGVHYQEQQQLIHFKARRAGLSRMKVLIKTTAPIRVAFMRHVGPYDQVGSTWDKLMVWLGKEGLIGSETLFIGLCHDDPEVTSPHKLRYDAAVSVADDFVPFADVGVQTIPGGEYAVTTHFGPYPKLGETYARLFGQWLPRSGRRAGFSPSFEMYLNNPEGTEPADLVTDIYVPLAPANPMTAIGTHL